MIEAMIRFFGATSGAELAWIGAGFLAQAMFTMRFVVQWIASETAGRSTVPTAFWYLSVAGGAMLLAYAVRRGDPVFIVGQASGLVVYLRNIYLIRAERHRTLRLAR